MHTPLNNLNSIHLKKLLYIILLLTPLVIGGCGGGSSSDGTAAKSATLSVGPFQEGTFTINGIDMDGVAAIDLTIGYPPGLYGPYVTAGALVSGANMTISSLSPDVIGISITRSIPFSGSGPLVKLSFDAGPIDMVVTINSVTLLDVNGHPL